MSSDFWVITCYFNPGALQNQAPQLRRPSWRACGTPGPTSWWLNPRSATIRSSSNPATMSLQLGRHRRDVAEGAPAQHRRGAPAGRRRARSAGSTPTSSSRSPIGWNGRRERSTAMWWFSRSVTRCAFTATTATTARACSTNCSRRCSSATPLWPGGVGIRYTVIRAMPGRRAANCSRNAAFTTRA